MSERSSSAPVSGRMDFPREPGQLAVSDQRRSFSMMQIIIQNPYPEFWCAHELLLSNRACVVSAVSPSSLNSRTCSFFDRCLHCCFETQGTQDTEQLQLLRSLLLTLPAQHPNPAGSPASFTPQGAVWDTGLCHTLGVCEECKVSSSETLFRGL